MNKFFLSHRQETLADALSDQLFSKGCKPFERHVIVVPCDQVKHFLLYRFAKDSRLNIAAGMQIISLSQALSELTFCETERKDAKVPNFNELSLEIESLIEHILTCQIELSGEEKKILFDLFEYFKNSLTSPLIRHQRLLDFSEQLASLFLHYQKMDPGFLKDWQEKTEWQQYIWNKLFSLYWTPLNAILTKRFSISFQWHFFDFDFLPKAILNFFVELGATFYVFSPCQMFWNDLCTDKERVYLQRFFREKGVKQKVQKEFDHYLKNQNSFLANLGKHGRLFLNFLEEKEIDFEESYPSHLQTMNLLHQIQKDILELDSSEERETKHFSLDDKSLQIHSTCSKLREVEVLHEIITDLIDKSVEDQDPLYPKDILILAPTVSEYVPYIRMVFDAKENKIPYTIDDLSLLSQSIFLQGFKHLLSIGQKRFDVQSILQLFDFPAFLAKFALTFQEADLICKWIKESHVHYALDLEQRRKFFEQDDFPLEETEQGTWTHAFERLLWNLAAFREEEAFSFSWQKDKIPFEEAETLGKFIYILRSLSEDLAPLLEAIKRPLAVWNSYLKALAESYFEMKDEDHVFFESFEQLCRSLSHLAEEGFFFAAIQRIFDRHCESSRDAAFSTLQTLRFTSLQEGRALPSRVIYLLGMNQESYPRREQEYSLCAISLEERRKNFSSQFAADRYLFLKLLFCARDFFFISYQNISEEDHKQQNPSLVVTELLSYLGQDSKSCSLVVTHSSLPLKRSLCSATQSLEKKQWVFIPEFYKASLFQNISEKNPLIIDIKQLERFAKDPLKFYFNQTLGIYCDRQRQNNHPDEEFLLSSLDKFHFRNAFSKTSFEILMQEAERQGRLPLGAFKEVAKQVLQEDQTQWKKTLETYKIEEDTLFSVELQLSCKQPFELSKNRWILPALCISLGHGRTAYLKGKLSSLCSKGLLFWGKESIEDLCKAWPLFLIFLNLPNFQAKKESCLLLMKDHSLKENCFEDPLGLLVNFLDYYEIGLMTPSLILPDWIMAFSDENSEKLQKKMKDSLDPFRSDPNPYLEWLFSKDPIPPADITLSNWKEIFNKTFRPMVHYWKQDHAKI